MRSIKVMSKIKERMIIPEMESGEIEKKMKIKTRVT